LLAANDCSRTARVGPLHDKTIFTIRPMRFYRPAAEVCGIRRNKTRSAFGMLVLLLPARLVICIPPFRHHRIARHYCRDAALAILMRQLYLPMTIMDLSIPRNLPCAAIVTCPAHPQERSGHALDQAAQLAKALGQLLDEVQYERLDFSGLENWLKASLQTLGKNV